MAVLQKIIEERNGPDIPFLVELRPVLAPWHICSQLGLLAATSSTNKTP